MTVYLVISLPKIPYIHRVYMVLANLTNVQMCKGEESRSDLITFIEVVTRHRLRASNVHVCGTQIEVTNKS